MILVDLSQILISSIHLNFKGNFKDVVEGGNKNLLKHVFLSSLLSYKKKFGEKYGEMILAADSKFYWRRDFFPAYKGHRARARDESDLDWGFIFECINEFKDDLKKNFKFKLIEVYGAEADDVIASLCKWSQSNGTTTVGLFDDEPQPILIISSDGDFINLQKYSNVKQFSPITGKFVTAKTNPHKHLIEKIVRGDGGDNIPNTFTDDKWAVERISDSPTIRQKSVTEKRLNEFFEKGIEACASESEKAYFQRNTVLIDFEYIPKSIYDKIIEEYEKYKILGSTNSIMNYFIANRMKQLVAEIGNF